MQNTSKPIWRSAVWSRMRRPSKRNAGLNTCAKTADQSRVLNSSHSVRMAMPCASLVADMTESCTLRFVSSILARRALPVVLAMYVTSSNICCFDTLGSYTCTMASSSSRRAATSMAADSRVSPVSFLNAQPRMATFLRDTVSNIVLIIFSVKRRRCQSFILITWCQYSATSGRLSDSARYVRLSTSFWKHEPPKPTDALRNLGPMRESEPMARLTSSTSAPVASHTAEMALMDEMRWARKALAVSFESSDDHTRVVRMRSRGTQLAYTSTTVWSAFWPASPSSPPSSTRSGLVRSAMAVPSARNSGLDRIEKVALLLPIWAPRIFLTAAAQRTGTVDFSMTMRWPSWHSSAMVRAQLSMYLRSAARPAPTPNIFVGVLTEMKMMSAFGRHILSVVKKRFLPRTCSTTSCSPGS
mmetsp:Transcript_11865/g.36901  ORF Transcript_11865/g.36901 Transcript_11865/m.36901 type:complete len:414 (-) Transcript_11865:231-1472(-)